MFATRIAPDVLKKLKHLSVDTEKSIADLIEEALNLLFKKHEDKPKKKSS